MMARGLTATCIGACWLLLGSGRSAAAQPNPPTETIVLDEITLTTSPSPPVRGDAAVVTITIPNRSTRAWRVSLTADLGAGALYRRASDTPQVRHRVNQDSANLGLAWTLVIGPGSTARVQVDVLMRYEESLPLIVRVDAAAADAETGTLIAPGATKSLQADAVWGTTDAVPALSLAGFLGLAVGLWALTVPTAFMLWRAGQRNLSGKRGALRAGAVAVALIGLVTAVGFSLAASSDWSLRGRYQQTTCKVTDRVMVPRGTDERVSNEFARAYGLLRAVEIATPAGAVAQIAGDSDAMPGEYYFDDDARRRFAALEPGQTYPCWYDPTRPREVTLQFTRSQLLYYALGGILLLVSVPGFVPALRRRL